MVSPAWNGSNHTPRVIALSLRNWESIHRLGSETWLPDCRKWITGNRSVPAVIMLQRFCRTRPWGGGAVMAHLLFYCKLFFKITCPFLLAIHIKTYAYIHKHTHIHKVRCYARGSDLVLTLTFACHVEEHALKKLHFISPSQVWSLISTEYQNQTVNILIMSVALYKVLSRLCANLSFRRFHLNKTEWHDVKILNRATVSSNWDSVGAGLFIRTQVVLCKKGTKKKMSLYQRHNKWLQHSDFQSQMKFSLWLFHLSPWGIRTSQKHLVQFSFPSSYPCSGP